MLTIALSLALSAPPMTPRGATQQPGDIIECRDLPRWATRRDYVVVVVGYTRPAAALVWKDLHHPAWGVVNVDVGDLPDGLDPWKQWTVVKGQWKERR